MYYNNFCQCEFSQNLIPHLFAKQTLLNCCCRYVYVANALGGEIVAYTRNEDNTLSRVQVSGFAGITDCNTLICNAVLYSSNVC